MNLERAELVSDAEYDKVVNVVETVKWGSERVRVCTDRVRVWKLKKYHEVELR